MKILPTDNDGRQREGVSYQALLRDHDDRGFDVDYEFIGNNKVEVIAIKAIEQER